MAIVDLQRRIAEAGRVRIGIQVPTANGNTRPAKLETFRLTSADKLRIDQAAALWGGKVEQWDAPAGKQWQVITEATALNVIVPPADMAFSMSYEMWSAGGCQRRCDGVSESLSGGECLCDPEQRTCDIHTRLSLLLRDLPGLGVWRLESQGWYAATELSGAVEVIQLAAGRGQLLPARLLLVQRQVKRQVDGKAQTRKFAVPVLDIEVTPGQLLAPSTPAPLALTQATSNGHDVDGSAALDRAPALTPVPATVQHRPAGSVAEQMKASTEPRERTRRKNSAAPVPPTGVEPRTAAQAYADNAERERNGNSSAIRQHLPGPTSDPDVTGPDGTRTRSLRSSDSPTAAASAARTAPDSNSATGPADSMLDQGDDGPGQVTSQQIRVLFAALTRHGFNAQKEPDTLLQVIETLAGRELTGPNKAVSGNLRTTKNLSRGEATQVIARLDSCDSQAAVWELVQTLVDPPAQLPFQDDPAPF